LDAKNTPQGVIIASEFTIFHHLPAAERAAIDRVLTAATNTTAPIEYRLTGLRMLGHGVAYSASSPRLSELRARLALRFDAWLTPQDRAGFSPHITVQNKVAAASARALLSKLTAEFQAFDAYRLVSISGVI
jgi:hypothetical protein